MIVADINTIVFFFLDTDKQQLANAVNARDPDWVAPPLWRSEFRNVLTNYLRRELLTLEEVLLIAGETEAAMVDREVPVASNRVLELAHQSTCSAYDCEFVALAVDLDVPLVTADRRLHKAFPETAVSLRAFVQSASNGDAEKLPDDGM